MKKIISIILVVLALSCQVKAGETLGSNARKIFLVTIIDTSPTSGSNWRQIKMLARQATDSLQPGDRLEVLSARPGRPVLHLNIAIDPPNIPANENLYGCFTDIHQAFFLSKANVARAVETAFDDLNQRCEDYQCCLIVLSDGKLSDNQIRQIRRLATAYRSRGWPFLFTAAKDGKRRLFIAGSQGELEVALIGQANLPQWLEKVRSAIIAEPAEEEIQEPPESTEDRPLESVEETASPPPVEAEPPEKPPLPLSKTTGGLPHIEEHNDILGVSPDVNSQPLDGKQPPARSGDPQQPEKPGIPGKPKTKAKKLFSILENKWPLALTAGGLLAGAILLLLILPLLKPAAGMPVLEQEGETAKDKEARLIALSNGERFDIGEEQAINELIVGTNPGSPIPIVDDDVEDQQFKIFRSHGRLKIKQLANEPLMVDGVSLKKGQKQDLLIPATIQVTKNLKIHLFREFPEKEDENPEIKGDQL